jgi:hypothetical protein
MVEATTTKLSPDLSVSIGGTAAGGAGTGDVALPLVNRRLPPQLARFYLPMGNRAGQRPPGGSDGARAIDSENSGRLADDGNAAVDYGRMSGLRRFLSAIVDGSSSASGGTSRRAENVLAQRRGRERYIESSQREPSSFVQRMRGQGVYQQAAVG